MTRELSSKREQETCLVMLTECDRDHACIATLEWDKEDRATKADYCELSPRNNCAPSVGAFQRTHDQRNRRIIFRGGKRRRVGVAHDVVLIDHVGRPVIPD